MRQRLRPMRQNQNASLAKLAKGAKEFANSGLVFKPNDSPFFANFVYGRAYASAGYAFARKFSLFWFGRQNLTKNLGSWFVKYFKVISPRCR